ncbi:serine hydrolase domain-containing protein [Gemmatimonas phototrophica]|uniref:serine hydrolase domain-containing protein n=1 Tax=Gemmatimonas phototrophica TaxID=1379270 RepID=UPI000946523E
MSALLPVNEFSSLAQRMTAKPEQPFGMPGVSLGIRTFEGKSIAIHSGTDNRGTRLGFDSLFCLSSASKLVVALLILELIDLGRLSPESTLSDVLPSCSESLKAVTIAQLLSHRGGLPQALTENQLPYDERLSHERIRAACLHVHSAPSDRVNYSDVGYGLLALIVEAKWEDTFESVIQTRINSLLGTTLVMEKADSSRVVRVVGVNATVVSDELAPINSQFWRNLALPWAGVFGTLDDIMTVALQFSSAGAMLSPKVRILALQDPDGGQLSGGLCEVGAHLGIAHSASVEWLECPWGLGPELRGSKAPHWAPREASPQSFGHVGTSGVLVWCDPEAKRVWAMAGTRYTATGWLFRYGPTFGRLAMNATPQP